MKDDTFYLELPFFPQTLFPTEAKAMPCHRRRCVRRSIIALSQPN